MKGISAMAAGATLFLGLGLMSYAAYAANPGDACSPEGVMGVNQDVAMTCTGGVWVLNALQLGDKSVTCDSGKAGYLRYSGGNFEGCDGSSWIQLAGGKPRSYAGATPTTYNGNLGGIAGANAKCANAFPGSRMMRLSELVYFASSMSNTGWIWAESGGIDQYNIYIGGCRVFTSSSAGDNGYAANGAGTSSSTPCSMLYKIHCVID